MNRAANQSGLSRRSFLENVLLGSASAALFTAQDLLEGRGWLASARAATPDLTGDTVNGLLAFVVPGSDAYSLAQGVSTVEAGGVDAGITDDFIATIDASTPFLPSFSAQVTAVLNGVALGVNPAAVGTFASPFANLSFAHKAAVFQVMDATESLELLGGLLPLFAAFFCYSEAGAFDPTTRSLRGQPLGWTLSHYRGVADGRDELLGYFPGVPHRSSDF